MQTIETYFKIRSEAQLFREFYEKRPSAARHAFRVASFSSVMAKAMGYDGAKYAALIKAALYHDIGKILIPDEIINNPKPVTYSEYEIIKDHVNKGVQLMGAKFSTEICQVVLQHHERLDGSGYPMGLQGESICEAARIIAICDSYDAMVYWRVYQPQKSSTEACLDLLSQSDIRYDGKLVRLFIECLNTQNAKLKFSGDQHENHSSQCS